jgi:tetratricopeptide (TPR) repeat protein
LMFIWVFLISFAFVAAANPNWLEDISHFGKTGESKGIKDFADNLLRQKRFAEAAAQYEKALQVKPEFNEALVNLAICYNMTGNPDRALGILRGALRKDIKRTGTINYNIGEVLENQGKIEEATAYYEKAIGSELEQDMVCCKLASLYYDTKQFEKARDMFEMTLEIQMDPSTPYRNMLRKNLEYFEDNQDEYHAIESLLDEHTIQNRLTAYDLDIIKKINDRNKEIAKVHNHLAMIYYLQGDFDKAIDHFEQSLKIWPGNRDAVKNLPLLRQMKNQERLAALPD